MPLPAESAGSTYTPLSANAANAPTGPIGHGARLDALLNELMRRVPELEAAAVVTADGLPMSSALPPGMDEDRVAAMSAALLSLGERAAEGLGRGELSQVHIQGEYGGVWLLAAGDDAVLVGVSAADAKAGLVLYELRRATAAVSTALAADELAEFAERTARAAMQPAPPEPAPPAPAVAPVPSVAPRHRQRWLVRFRSPVRHRRPFHPPLAHLQQPPEPRRRPVRSLRFPRQPRRHGPRPVRWVGHETRWQP